MAKRKRLSALGMVTDSDSKTDLPVTPRQIPPVARIAADAATQSALSDLADEMRQARETGRLILDLPLEDINAEHLKRDRMFVDPEELAVLSASISDRGQQTPMEVVSLPGGALWADFRWTAADGLASAP